MTHVLREREMAAVRAALAALERALGEVREAALDADPAVRAQARTRVRRLQQLIELSRAALQMLRILVDSARADVGPLKALSELFARGLSGRGRTAPSPPSKARQGPSPKKKPLRGPGLRPGREFGPRPTDRPPASLGSAR